MYWCTTPGRATPTRRCSRCFSPRSLCFDRAARGHSRRGGRPPGSDLSTFFGFDAGELWRVRADVNKPATLAIFCSHFDKFVCGRTIAILPEQVDPFLFFRCRRDRMSRKPCTPTSASANPTTGARRSFFGFGSRGEAAATQVCVPVFESMVPRARAPQLPPTVSLTAASLAHCLASALAALLLVLPRRHAAAATVHRWTGIAALLRRRECTPRSAVATGVAAASSHVGSTDDHRRQGAHASWVAACEKLTGRGAVKYCIHDRKC